jgi:hypothetical protein
MISFTANWYQVVSSRNALLSNCEVLQLLREREAEQNIHAHAAMVKKEGDDADNSKQHYDMITLVSQNVRTVQFEVCLETPLSLMCCLPTTS